MSTIMKINVLLLVAFVYFCVTPPVYGSVQDDLNLCAQNSKKVSDMVDEIKPNRGIDFLVKIVTQIQLLVNTNAQKFQGLTANVTLSLAAQLFGVLKAGIEVSLKLILSLRLFVELTLILNVCVKLLGILQVLINVVSAVLSGTVKLTVELLSSLISVGVNIFGVILVKLSLMLSASIKVGLSSGTGGLNIMVTALVDILDQVKVSVGLAVNVSVGLVQKTPGLPSACKGVTDNGVNIIQISLRAIVALVPGSSDVANLAALLNIAIGSMNKMYENLTALVKVKISIEISRLITGIVRVTVEVADLLQTCTKQITGDDSRISMNAIQLKVGLDICLKVSANILGLVNLGINL